MISHVLEAPYMPDLRNHPTHAFLIRYRIDKLFDLISPSAIVALEEKSLAFRKAQFDKAHDMKGYPFIDTAFECYPCNQVRYAFASNDENDDIELFIRSVNLLRLREIVASIGSKLPRRPSPVLILWSDR